MATITITVDATVEADCDAAFLASYANPDGLTGQQLCELHTKNFIAGVINNWKMNVDVDAARTAAEQYSDISTGAT